MFIELQFESYGHPANKRDREKKIDATNIEQFDSIMIFNNHEKEFKFQNF